MGRDKDESSEYTTVSSEPSEFQSRQGSLYGNLKTRLRWEPTRKQMHVDVRQNLQNSRSLELRYKGRLNTHDGSFQYIAQLQKNMHQNTPSLARIIAAEQGVTLRGERSINPDRFLPGGLSCLLWRDWAMSPGVRLSNTTEPAAAADAGSSGSGSSSGNGSGGLKYFISFRKQPQVLRRSGVWDSWLTGKADLELDPAKQQIGVRGGLRLKVFRFNLTDKQDLQLQCGADFASCSSSSSRLTPYMKVGDNSWTMRLQRGELSFNYEI